jgi:hypothetical protein
MDLGVLAGRHDRCRRGRGRTALDLEGVVVAEAHASRVLVDRLEHRLQRNVLRVRREALVVRLREAPGDRAHGSLAQDGVALAVEVVVADVDAQFGRQLALLRDREVFPVERAQGLTGSAVHAELAEPPPLAVLGVQLVHGQGMTEFVEDAVGGGVVGAGGDPAVLVARVVHHQVARVVVPAREVGLPVLAARVVAREAVVRDELLRCVGLPSGTGNGAGSSSCPA